MCVSLAGCERCYRGFGRGGGPGKHCHCTGSILFGVIIVRIVVIVTGRKVVIIVTVTGRLVVIIIIVTGRLLFTGGLIVIIVIGRLVVIVIFVTGGLDFIINITISLIISIGTVATIPPAYILRLLFPATVFSPDLMSGLPSTSTVS